MNTRRTIKTYLGLAVVVHVAAVVVAIYSINAAVAYWSNFLEGSPFPQLFKTVLASAHWLPWLSLSVALVGILVAIRASEPAALHCLAGILGITVFALCFTAVGLSKPMWLAARFMEEKAANHTSEGIRHPVDGLTKPSM